MFGYFHFFLIYFKLQGWEGVGVLFDYIQVSTEAALNTGRSPCESLHS